MFFLRLLLTFFACAPLIYSMPTEGHYEADPTLYVEYPPAINSSIQFHLGHQSPLIVGMDNNGRQGINGSVLVAYPDFSLCNLNPVDQFGRNYSGSIILASVSVGPCGSAAYQKVQLAQSYGAKAVVFVTDVIYDKENWSPFTFVRSLLQWNGLNLGQKIKIPYMVISNNEGMNLFQYMQNHNEPVNVFIPGTYGPTDPIDVEAFRKFAQAAISTSAAGLVSLDQKIPINNFISNPNLDPCIDGAVGVIHCQNNRITHLWYFQLGLNGFVSPFINNMTELTLLQLAGSPLNTFPDISSLSKLRSLVLPDRVATMSIPNTLFFNKPNLEVFCARLVRTLPPGLEKISTLKVLDFRVTNFPKWPISPFNAQTFPNLYQLYANNIPTMRDNFLNLTGFTELIGVDLTNTPFITPPGTAYLDNLPKIRVLKLTASNFTGTLPSLKNCAKLAYLSLDGNQFEGSIPAWNLPVILSLQLNNNKLTGPINSLSTCCPVIQELYMQNNLISDTNLQCPDPSKCADFIITMLPSYVSKINFQNNSIAGTFGIGITGYGSKNIKSLIFANNKLTGVGHYAFSFLGNFLEELDMSFNNISTYLPQQVIVPYTTMKRFSFKGNPYCINNGGNALLYSWFKPGDSFTLDVSSTYLCPILIGDSTQGFSSSMIVEFDPFFTKYKNCVCNRGLYGIPPNCKKIPSVTYSNASFSDSDFGNLKYFAGIDTLWVMKDINRSPKVINLNLTMKANFWSLTENILEVYEGIEDLSGSRVASWKGNNNYQYVDQTFSVQILNQAATLSFRSKVESASFFSAKYYFSYECPNGFEPEKDTGICHQLFVTSIGIQTVVYILSALVSSLLLLTILIVVKKRNTLVIKSSSFPFCLSILFFLLLMSFSSIFYGFYPQDHFWVCDARPWFTSISLVGVLSSLLVKADRIRKIFTSTDLVVQAISNAQLFKIMLVMLMLQIALLLGLSLSEIMKSVALVGHGTTANMIVYTCGDQSQEENFNAWLGVQIIYISLFLVAGVYEAWGVRKVPTAFNEGPHIASALLSLVVLLVILVPLNFITSDNPNALVIIRGIGQNLIVIVMTFFLFGPKIFYILEGRENDKTLSSIGSKSNSSSSSSSSSASKA